MVEKPEYKEKIDTWVEAHRDEMLEDLKKLIRIPSVKGAPGEGMPYGEMPAKAILAMQDMMEDYGFRTSNYGMRCIAGDLDAEGEKTLDILAHLDVVPVSDSWTKTKPFEPLVEGDRIYGRGTSDDKGPAIAALYAMRCVRELGLNLKNGVRLICGSDEECGSDDLRYYYRQEKEALYTFSPDADYPLIHIEKGRLKKRFHAAGSLSGAAEEGKKQDAGLPVSTEEGKKPGGIFLRRIHAGDTSNIVPGTGILVLSGVQGNEPGEAAKKAQLLTGGTYSWETDGEICVVTAKGESAHAASPETGINAATMILSFLSCLNVEPDSGTRILDRIGTLWPHGMSGGEGLGVSCSDQESGALTISLDILNYEVSEDGSSFCLEGTFDCRAPLCCNDRNLTDRIRARLEEAGLQMEEGGMIPAHYVSADSELVRKLLESYELYFGKKGKPVAIGGGTYVHNLERGVAFGCAVPEVDNCMHGDDEFMEIPMLLKSTKIFADAILRLCGG